MAYDLPKLCTKRLYLRNISYKDAEIIVSWRSDPDVYRFFLNPHVISIEDHLKWYKNNYLMDNNRCDWIAYDKENDPVGIFGIRKDLDDDNEAEISYILAPNKRGQGYAKEAILSVIGFVKERWKCEYITATIHEENKDSLKFAERLEMYPVSKVNSFWKYQKKIDNKFINLKKKIYIRVDGNESIGLGHVMRCLSIADQLKKFDIEILFITADHSISSLIQDKGFREYSLCSKWDDLESEINSIIPFLKSNKPDILLIDSYYVNEEYFNKLKKYSKIYYIDDLNKIKTPIFGLINYNIYGENFGYDTELYKKMYLGLRYVPLRNEFLDIPKRYYRGIHKILITSGGTDEYNVIEKFLVYFQKINIFNKLEFYCVIGKFNKNRERLNGKFKVSNNVHLLYNVDNISEYMKICDVAITAGGTTCYELCACGIPSIIYTLADNQYGIAKTFANKKIIPWIGDIRENMQKVLNNLEKELNKLDNEETWKKRSLEMQLLVDGKGATRLAEILNDELKG